MIYIFIKNSEMSPALIKKDCLIRIIMKYESLLVMKESKEDHFLKLAVTS